MAEIGEQIHLGARVFMRREYTMPAPALRRPEPDAIPEGASWTGSGGLLGFARPGHGPDLFHAGPFVAFGNGGTALRRADPASSTKPGEKGGRQPTKTENPA